MKGDHRYKFQTNQTAKLPPGAKLARGRPRRAPRGMNKTEAKYADELALRQKVGEVQWWAFEPMSLKLADGASYKPDFGVLLADSTFEFVEIKGEHWREAARVRIKVATKTYWMFRFRAVQYKRGSVLKEETWN